MRKIRELSGLAGRDAGPVARPDQTRPTPDVVEEVEMAQAFVPVWSKDGIICTGETYKDKVKLTFDKGASLDDPKGLFNASLDGNARRAIDFPRRRAD
jgi:hypothetical protein